MKKWVAKISKGGRIVASNLIYADNDVIKEEVIAHLEKFHGAKMGEANAFGATIESVELESDGGQMLIRTGFGPDEYT